MVSTGGHRPRAGGHKISPKAKSASARPVRDFPRLPTANFDYYVTPQPRENRQVPAIVDVIDLVSNGDEDLKREPEVVAGPLKENSPVKELPRVREPHPVENLPGSKFLHVLELPSANKPLPDGKTPSKEPLSKEFPAGGPATKNLSSLEHPLPKKQLLDIVYEIFPDISKEYVLKIYDNYRDQVDGVIVERMTDEILGKLPYPKEPKETDPPREKRPKTVHPKVVWKIGDGVCRDRQYCRIAARFIRYDFCTTQVVSVDQALHGQTAFEAYQIIGEKAGYPVRPQRSPYLLEPTRLREVDVFNMKHPKRFNSLMNELNDARVVYTKKANEYQRKAAEERAEAEFYAQAQAERAVLECQCCYNDTPLPRLVCCDQNDAHTFCFDCMCMSAANQIGLLRYQLKCMDISGCNGTFPHAALRAVLNPSLQSKLSTLQQADEVARAGLSGLVECPFCDFKAECAPVSEDREFRCANPSCRRISCRLCNRESHVPATCEQVEAASDGERRRHGVEEAMTEALVRTCPNQACRLRIIKESGCNKMRCVRCKSIMCYICEADITHVGYRHFEGSGGGPIMPMRPEAPGRGALVAELPPDRPHPYPYAYARGHDGYRIGGGIGPRQALPTNLPAPEPQRPRCRLWDSMPTEQYHQVDVERARLAAAAADDAEMTAK